MRSDYDNKSDSEAAYCIMHWLLPDIQVKLCSVTKIMNSSKKEEQSSRYIQNDKEENVFLNQSPKTIRLKTSTKLIICI